MERLWFEGMSDRLFEPFWSGLLKSPSNQVLFLMVFFRILRF